MHNDNTYTTKQGDMWDIIAYTLYGNERYMYILIDANPKHNTTVVFPANIVLTIPPILQKNKIEFPSWRRG